MAQIARLATITLLIGLTGQLAAEGASEGAVQHSLFSMIIGAGPVMWILILLSVVGISIGIQRMLTIKRDILVPDGLADELHQILEEGLNEENVEDALNAASNDPSMLGEILSAALDKREFGYEAMNDAAESVGSAEHNKYMSQINWLSLLAAIGPMLGLLGTVIGMIFAFLKMASTGGSVNPALLANEIGGAMLTTAGGLIIAIPMMFFFFFLRARINACVLDSGVLTAEILDYFRPQK